MVRSRKHSVDQATLWAVLPQETAGVEQQAQGGGAQLALLPGGAGTRGIAEECAARGPVVFRSGMSSRTDFLGCAASGVPVGVAILDVSRPVFEMLVAHNQGGGRLFVDSNAFSAFRKSEEVDFDKVLRRYADLVSRAGRPDRLTLVMPDRIGDQMGTLALLAEHRSRVLEFVAAGADVLVPLQKGALPLAEVYRETVATLGTDEFRVGLPSKEEAVTEEELFGFVAEIKPRRMHLLGIARQRRFTGLLARLRALSPETHVSSDANHLRGAIGKGRKLTEAVRLGVHEETVACMFEGSTELGVQDETEFVGGAYGTPQYLTGPQARLFARAVTDDEALVEEIVEAARATERGEEHGSRLGDVLEREFPGRCGEAVVWDAYRAVVGRAAGASVRSREITRLALAQRRAYEEGWVAVEGGAGVRSHRRLGHHRR